MVLIHTRNNSHLTDFIVDPQPLVKPPFKSLDLPGQPYGMLDFMQIADRAIYAFKNKSKWIPNFDVCNSLFLPSKLDVIHRAKSVAAFIVLYRFALTLEEFYLNPYEVVYTYVLPMVNDQVSIHEAYKVDSINRFTACLQQIAKLHYQTVKRSPRRL